MSKELVMYIRKTDILVRLFNIPPDSYATSNIRD